MSSVYLVIVLGFIVALFRQDQREWPQFSVALWIPLIWLLSSTTRLIQILFPMGGSLTGVPSIEATIEGNPISRNVSIALIILGAVILYKRKNTLSTLFHANRGIFSIYAYLLLTIIWSDYPDVSIKRFIRLLGAIVIAFIVASEEDHHGAMEHLMRRYITICLTLSLFFIKTDRSVGYVIGVHGSHFMAGITGHKNELGVLCMFSVIILMVRALKLWPSINYLDYILILLNAYLLLRARSMTALVLALLGMAIILGIRLMKGKLQNAMIIVIMLLIMTSPIIILTLNSPSSVIPGAFFNATDKDATLSGRIPMWGDLIHMGRKEIIFGSGYESFWLKHYNEIWLYWNFLPTNAHNGYVEVLLNLGLVGLGIVIIVIFKTLFHLGSKEQLSQQYGVLYFVFFIMFIINNITEASLVRLSLGWSLLLIILSNSEKSRLQRLGIIKE